MVKPQAPNVRRSGKGAADPGQRENQPGLTDEKGRSPWSAGKSS
jgi:hypothetical protein